MKRIAIERRRRVSPGEIVRDYLSYGGKPIIITDAMDDWPARPKWTFEYFKQTYGSDIVTAWLGPGSAQGKLTSLSAYIDFIDEPWELPGLWIGKDGLPIEPSPIHGNSPPYLIGWQAFQRHPELYEDIEPAPYFVPDLVSALSPTVRQIFEATSEREYSAVYIGPKGSLAALHRDYWDTHSYLAQLQGRKYVILFAPSDSDLLYGGQVDPEKPDLPKFPLMEQATAHEGVIEPGDTLLMPANWWHHVRSLEKSVTVSRNFFNESNFNEHMTHVLQNLPRLVQSLNNSSDYRCELKIAWQSSDFKARDP